MKKAEREHLNRITSLGCIVCRNNGYYGTPAEVHHIRSGQGIGQRASNYETLPLCPFHHRSGGYGNAFHAGPKVWQEKFGTERELLAQVQELLEVTA